MRKYDVIIVGAGPAGACCGMSLAEAGVKVALLERDTFPRDKACGGGIVQMALDEYPWLSGELKNINTTEVRRFSLYSSEMKEKVDISSQKPLLYSVHRTEFDELLARKAQQAGAELREGIDVRGIEIREDGVQVKLRGGDELTARMVVGAAGMHDPVAKVVRKRNGLPEKWDKGRIGFVLTKEFPADTEFIENAFGPERTSHVYMCALGIRGYAWVFPKEDAVNVGYGAFWDTMKRLDQRAYFEKLMVELEAQGLVPEGTKLGKYGGAWLPLRGPISSTTTDRALLIGDAAGFVSPLGGDGIHYAMISGKWASDTIAQALNAGDLSNSALRPYHDRWGRAWQKEFDTLCYLADKVMDNVDRVVRFGQKDARLRELMMGVACSLEDPVKAKWPVLRRFVRDVLLYDILGR